MKIELKDIGRVRSAFRKPEDLHFACEKGVMVDTESEIIINDEFSECLKGLDSFSHLWIIYLLHEADRIELETHPGPPKIEDLPKVGVFASRSQYRPNHIALRLVRLEKVGLGNLLVKGLDAIDNTPVLDIKPFVPHFDRADGERIARWYEWGKSGSTSKEEVSE